MWRPDWRLVCLDCRVKVTQYVTPDGVLILVGTDNRVHAVGRDYLPLLAAAKRKGPPR